MELIDKVVRKIDFLVGFSDEDITLLDQVLNNQVTVDVDRNDPLSLKAHDYFVGPFYKFISVLRGEMEKDGFKSDSPKS